MTTTKRGEELKTGDALMFLGQPHTLTHFEPYTGTLLGLLGEGTRIARSGAWGMTITPKDRYEVLA